MIYQGNCMDVMREMINADMKVQTCVTSPPYWGLRDYNMTGQLGLEKTPEEFIENMVKVFDLVGELLATDGTLWINIGDSYAGAPGGGQGKNGQRAARGFTAKVDHKKGGGDLKPKDLVGIPWMLAFALRARGWYLRQEIIWAKPNPMPESVSDRCTKAHEQIFLLTKSPRYYFDQDAILEPCSPNTHARMAQDVMNQAGSDRAHAGGKTNGNMKAVVRNNGVGWGHGTDKEERDRDRVAGRKSAKAGKGVKSNPSWDAAHVNLVENRNKRTVWTVSTQACKDAHFATYPPKLIEPCILAGSRPSDTVFDPFNGAGTTGMVAYKHGRRYIGIELNPDYIEISRGRMRNVQVDLLTSSGVGA